MPELACRRRGRPAGDGDTKEGVRACLKPSLQPRLPSHAGAHSLHLLLQKKKAKKAADGGGKELRPSAFNLTAHSSPATLAPRAEEEGKEGRPRQGRQEGRQARQEGGGGRRGGGGGG